MTSDTFGFPVVNLPPEVVRDLYCIRDHTNESIEEQIRSAIWNWIEEAAWKGVRFSGGC